MKNFVINNAPYKIILLLCNLKFKTLKEEEKCHIPLKNAIYKILWLEANSKYIKDI